MRGTQLGVYSEAVIPFYHRPVSGGLYDDESELLYRLTGRIGCSCDA